MVGRRIRQECDDGAPYAGSIAGPEPRGQRPQPLEHTARFGAGTADASPWSGGQTMWPISIVPRMRPRRTARPGNSHKLNTLGDSPADRHGAKREQPFNISSQPTRRYCATIQLFAVECFTRKKTSR